MGGTCTTPQCDASEAQITASRILTSLPLTISELFNETASEPCPVTETPTINPVLAYEIQAIADLESASKTVTLEVCSLATLPLSINIYMYVD